MSADPIQRLEAGIRKANAAGDTKTVRILGAELRRIQAAAPAQPRTAPRQKGTGIGPLDFALNAINETAIGAAEGAYDLGAMVTDPLVGLVYGSETKKKLQQQRKGFFEDVSRQVSSQPMSVYRETGKIIAPAGAVSRTAKLAAPVLRNVPVAGNALARIANYASSGGIGSGRTAAQTSARTQIARGKALAERATGGAIAGGLTAAAAGQDPITGAAIGGALPVVASPVRMVAGKIVDVFRTDKVRAAQMFRDALKTDIDAARAAFANMTPGDQRLARKVLIDEGIKPNTFMALGADVERLHPERVTRNQEAEMAAARSGLETAAGVAPGGSPADVDAAVRGGRADVSTAMTPAREGAIRNILDVNEEARLAENLLTEARTGAAQQSTLAAEQGDTARRLTGSAAFFGDSPAFVRGADVAAYESEAAAAEAARLRGVAADAEDAIYRLNAADVKPQRGAPLVFALRKMAKKPGTRMSTLQRSTLTTIADKIERGMDQNGMVNPYDMYQLRKSELNDVIGEFQNKILQGQAPKSGDVERASSLAGSVRDLIDDTLGPEFKDYLSRSAQGYQAVNRKQLAAEALTRFTAPNNEGFLSLVRNREPKTVGGIMQGGPELENINNAFATDPRFGALTNAAKLLESRNSMNELAASGTVAAGELMKQTPPSWLRPVTRIALSRVPAGRIAAEGAGQLAGDLMDQNVRKRLAEGFMSGQNANNLLNTYAAGILTDAEISKLNPYQRNFLAQSMRNYFMPTDQNAGY
jgi:hypothetical protein